MPARRSFDAVLLGVKPQLLDQVAPRTGGAGGPGHGGSVDPGRGANWPAWQRGSRQCRGPWFGSCPIWPRRSASRRSCWWRGSTRRRARCDHRADGAARHARMAGRRGLFDAVTALARIGPGFRLSLHRCAGRGRGGAGPAARAGRTAGAGDGRGCGRARRGIAAWPRRTGAARGQPGRRPRAGRARGCWMQTRRWRGWSTATLRAARDRSAEMAEAARGKPPAMNTLQAAQCASPIRFRLKVSASNADICGALADQCGSVKQEFSQMANWNDPQPTRTGFGASPGVGRIGGAAPHRCGSAPVYAVDLQLHGLGRPALGRGGDAVRPSGMAAQVIRLAAALAGCARAARLRHGDELRPEPDATSTLQMLFWAFCVAMGLSLSSIFLRLHRRLDRGDFLRHGGRVRRAQPGGLHHQARSVGDGLVHDHGPVGHPHRHAAQRCS